QAEDGIRDKLVTGVQTCALPISFDMEDARLLSMMARQASAVLVTSQLYWKEVEKSKRITTIFESTSVGIMAVSPKGTVTQVNARSEERRVGKEGRDRGGGECG